MIKNSACDLAVFNRPRRNHGKGDQWNRMALEPDVLPCLPFIPDDEQLGNRHRMVDGEFMKQVHGLFLHLMHNIDHRAIAVTHNGYDAVGEFNRLWFTGQQTGTFAQPLNGNHFNARFLQTFCQFRTCRVNCDTVVCDQNIVTGARGDAGQHVIHQSRNTTAYQRRDDDGKRRGNRGIAVTTGSTTQYESRYRSDHRKHHAVRRQSRSAR